MNAALPHDHRDDPPPLWPLVAAVLGYTALAFLVGVGCITVAIWFMAV